ncbi:hypothetical protein IU469_30830 [Nocardia puris]|uniref:hypothetical protein n=1 Tax=Nocardia puris TaxID=208602 RepID=UPI0011BF980C|nr:hypothetical protein [Nocardia puris]MBF6213140.1 hypothetical protein [Nocardia puris]MBF6370069.1 hypothetical protein [Nocardia puris]
MSKPRHDRRGEASHEAIDRANRLREVSRSRIRRSRDREKSITVEAKKYFAAGDAISAIEHRRDAAIARLERQIEEQRATAAGEIFHLLETQAAAVRTIRELEPDDDAVVELLETPLKAMRQLLARVDRELKARTKPSTTPTEPGPAMAPNNRGRSS